MPNWACGPGQSIEFLFTDEINEIRSKFKCVRLWKLLLPSLNTASRGRSYQSTPRSSRLFLSSQAAFKVTVSIPSFHALVFLDSFSFVRVTNIDLLTSINSPESRPRAPAPPPIFISEWADIGERERERGRRMGMRRISLYVK